MNKLKLKILVRLFGWKHGWKVLRYNSYAKVHISSHSRKGNEYPIGEKVTRKIIKLRGKKYLFGPLAVFKDQLSADVFRASSGRSVLSRSTRPCLYKPSKDSRYWFYSIVRDKIKKIRGGWMPDGKAFADAVIIL